MPTPESTGQPDRPDRRGFVPAPWFTGQPDRPADDGFCPWCATQGLCERHVLSPPAPAPAAEPTGRDECTCVGGSWCAHHGTCTCPPWEDRERGDELVHLMGNIWQRPVLSSPTCPLHGAEPTGPPGCVPECNGTWPGPERRPFHVRDCPNAEPTGRQRAADVPALCDGCNEEHALVVRWDDPNSGEAWLCAPCADRHLAALHADNERLTAERDALRIDREWRIKAEAENAALDRRLAAVEAYLNEQDAMSAALLLPKQPWQIHVRAALSRGTS